MFGVEEVVRGVRGVERVEGRLWVARGRRGWGRTMARGDNPVTCMEARKKEEVTDRISISD